MVSKLNLLVVLVLLLTLVGSNDDCSCGCQCGPIVKIKKPKRVSCPPRYELVGNSCYKFLRADKSQSKFSYTMAKAQCAADGYGSLVVFESVDEAKRFEDWVKKFPLLDCIDYGMEHAGEIVCGNTGFIGGRLVNDRLIDERGNPYTTMYKLPVFIDENGDQFMFDCMGYGYYDKNFARLHESSDMLWMSYPCELMDPSFSVSTFCEAMPY